MDVIRKDLLAYGALCIFIISLLSADELVMFCMSYFTWGWGKLVVFKLCFFCFTHAYFLLSASPIHTLKCFMLLLNCNINVIMIS